MRRPGRSSCAAVLVCAAALALPASALAHAVLLRTTPSASGVVNTPPPEVRLRFSEPVEPEFAIVSVTNAAGEQVTVGPPRNAPGSPDELVTPLRTIPQGWYLVFWRAISADGHPVRGAFTFAVGPSPGPPPQFVVPSIRETAAKPSLVVARWATFLSTMLAIGLLVLRTLIGRPLLRMVPGSSLRAVSIVFWVALGAALVATPVFLLLATAQFALRDWYDLGALVPLVRTSAFGRALVELELVFALLGIAAACALLVDRPRRPQRSVAELLALVGVLAAAGATLAVISAGGHAATTSPRGLALSVDWLHLVTGSVWVGGLVGLMVLWLSAGAVRRVGTLSYVVPRFSRVALVSVFLLVASGTGSSLLHLPTLSSLWETSYGQALMVKIALLLAAGFFGAINFARTTPRLAAAESRPEAAAGAAVLLRRLVSGEIVLATGAIAAAAVLTSLAPPSKALAQVGEASAKVGPGPVAEVVEKDGYRLAIRIDPNRAAIPNTFTLTVTRGGRPVRGATVVARFAMLDMEMGQQEYELRERRPGVFEHSAPALVMVGHWGLDFEVRPPGGRPFDVLIVDRANG